VHVFNKAIFALWDTGSAVTVFSDRILQQLPREKIKECSAREKQMYDLRTANGSTLSVSHVQTLPIRTADRTWPQKCIFVSNLGHDAILGVDFMRTCHASIDFDQAHVSLEGGRRLPFLDAQSKRPYVHALSTTHTVTIPPLSSKLVKTCFDSRVSQDASMANTYHVTPLMAGQDTSNDLVVPASVVTATSKRIPVMMINTSFFPLDITKGTRVALAESIRSEQIADINLLDDRSGNQFPEQEKTQKNENVVERIDFSKAPKSIRQQLKAVFRKHYQVLSQHSYDVGHCKIMPQRIEISDRTKLPCIPPYRAPAHLREVIDDYVHNLTTAGIIQRTNSPFSSPIMLVKKPHAKPNTPLIDQYRVVNDFRRLNAVTIKDAYPMRHLYELIDEIASSKLISILDLKHSFWAQELEPSSRKYTSFGVPGKGSFEFRRSAQGLVNSSSSFQRLLDHITRDLPYVRTYIDDIVVFSQSEQEHVRHVATLLQTLQRHGLKCNPEKIQLAAGEVDYLGYRIAPGRFIRPGKAKVDSIKNWQLPRTKKQIRQFVGLCSFFRRTIPDFARRASPLHKLIKKDSPFKDGQELPLEAKQAFQFLQRTLCSSPCLRPVDFNKQFILTTDASKEGMGAVLSQNHDGIEHPVAYASRVTKEAEKKLAPFHLEYAAMLFGCKHFRPYLIGKEFVLRTDHKPLVTINRNQSEALGRLQVQLMEYMPFEIKYLKGDHMPADALSRLETVLLIEAQGTKEIPNSSNFKQSHIRSFQKQDLFCKAMNIYLRFGKLINTPRIRNFVLQHHKEMRIIDGILFAKSMHHQWVPYAPIGLRNLILYHYHDHQCAGHPGAERMKATISLYWHWINMSQDIQTYVQSCQTCQRHNKWHTQPRAPLGNFPLLAGSLLRIHVDILQLPTTNEGYKYLLVIIDAFSKWVELVPLRTKEAEEVAQGIVEKWILRHGVPTHIISDQGKEFVNGCMKSIETLMGIKHNTTTAMHPQSNGQAERINSEILAYFRKYWSQNQQWTSQVAFTQWAHNSAFHSSLGMSPYNALYGRECPHPVDDQHRDSLRRINHNPAYHGNVHNNLLIVEQELRQRRNESRELYEQMYNKKGTDRPIPVGSEVYITAMSDPKRPKKFQPKFQGPYTIITCLGQYNYLLKPRNREGKNILVHHNRIKVIAQSREDGHQSHQLDRNETLRQLKKPTARPTREETQADPWGHIWVDDDEMSEQGEEGNADNRPGRIINHDGLFSDSESSYASANDSDSRLSLPDDFEANDPSNEQGGENDVAAWRARLYEEASTHRPMTRSQARMQQ